MEIVNNEIPAKVQVAMEVLRDVKADFNPHEKKSQIELVRERAMSVVTEYLGENE